MSETVSTPADLAKQINDVLGWALVVRNPDFFSASRKGLPVFDLECRSVENARFIIALLGQADFVDTKTKHSDVLPFAMRGAWQTVAARSVYTPGDKSPSSEIVMHVPLKQVANLVKFFEDNKELLPAPQILPTAPHAKAGMVPYEIFFGKPAGRNPLPFAEAQAYLDYLRDTKQSLADVPVDVLAAGQSRGHKDIMMAMIETANPGSYDAAVLRALMKHKNAQTLAMWKQRCDKPDFDYVFNRKTFKIEPWSLGSYYEALREGRHYVLGAATYWNPEAGQYYKMTSTTLHYACSTSCSVHHKVLKYGAAAIPSLPQKARRLSNAQRRVAALING